MKLIIFFSFSIAFLCCTLLTADAYANNWKTKSTRKIGRSGPSVSKYQMPGQRLKHTVLNKNFAPRVPRAKMAFGSTNAYGSPISWSLSISKNTLRNDWHVHWNAQTGLPKHLRWKTIRPAGKVAVRPAVSNGVDLTYTFLEKYQDIFGISEPTSEFLVSETIFDGRGQLHVIMQQYYKGIPVWGGQLNSHVDGLGLYALNSNYQSLAHIDVNTSPTLSSAEAIKIVTENVEYISNLPPSISEVLEYSGPESTLLIWNRDIGKERLVWRILVRPQVHQRDYYFVDAHSGEIVHRYSASPSEGSLQVDAKDLNGQDKTLQVFEQDSLFFLADFTRPIYDPDRAGFGGLPRGSLLTMDLQGRDLARDVDFFIASSQDNQWSDAIAVSAHANMGRVFEYFYDTFGRSGIDGDGDTIISLIHVTDQGESMANAYWNGRFIAYGDGNDALSPLAGSLDVAAHEFSHGLIERTVNLEYQFQSGALNESIADVFGVLIDDEDWLVGEDVVSRDYFPSGALRNMADPHNNGNEGDFFWQPSHMREYVELTIDQDNGGVHVNSGIPNKAAHLLAESIGREKLGQIYYRVLDARYLNARSGFTDMRFAVIQAATDLYGLDSVELNSATAAFDQVGILGDEELVAPEPVELPIVKGEEWLAVVNAESFDNSLYLVRPNVSDDDDIVQLTETQVFVETGNAITVSEDGSYLFFVDDSNFIRGINIDGSNEEVLSNEGEWSSISLSPGGNRLAATSVFEDSTIFIFDLVNPENSIEMKLYNPTTQDGIRSNTVLFADALDWDLSGQFLVYDAYNNIRSGEDTLGYWDIAMIDVENKLIFSLFAALPEGVHMGNPSFAQTNPRYLAFDFHDVSSNQYAVGVADLFENEVGIILETDASFSFPRFSVDDEQLVFETYLDAEYTVYQLSMAEDRLSSVEDPFPFLQDAQSAIWFAIGSRPDVETFIGEISEDSLPAVSALQQNFPNPFNSNTSISYTLSTETSVDLKIYDVLGQEIAILHTGLQSPGEYKVFWDGLSKNGQIAATGTYLCVLSVGNDDAEFSREVRKMILVR